MRFAYQNDDKHIKKAMKIKLNIGSGKELLGESVVLVDQQCQETAHLDSSLEGKIAVCMAPVGREFLHKSLFIGLAGVVAPSVHYKDWISINPDDGMPVYIMKKFGIVELSDKEKGELAGFDGKKIKISKEENYYELAIAS